MYLPLLMKVPKKFKDIVIYNVDFIFFKAHVAIRQQLYQKNTKKIKNENNQPMKQKNKK